MNCVKSHLHILILFRLLRVLKMNVVYRLENVLLRLLSLNDSRETDTVYTRLVSLVSRYLKHQFRNSCIMYSL